MSVGFNSAKAQNTSLTTSWFNQEIEKIRNISDGIQTTQYVEGTNERKLLESIKTIPTIILEQYATTTSFYERQYSSYPDGPNKVAKILFSSIQATVERLDKEIRVKVDDGFKTMPNVSKTEWNKISNIIDEMATAVEDAKKEMNSFFDSPKIIAETIGEISNVLKSTGKEDDTIIKSLLGVLSATMDTLNSNEYIKEYTFGDTNKKFSLFSDMVEKLEDGWKAIDINTTNDPVIKKAYEDSNEKIRSLRAKLNSTATTVVSNAVVYNTTYEPPESGCPKGAPFMSFNPTRDSIVSHPACSVVGYLINLLLTGINKMLVIFVSWAGAFFDWIMEIGVYGFSDWVTNSGAYDIWRTIILALVTSLLLPLVFYLIIRMLIDNDTSNIEKILPKILFTALFVYFSFSIVGWIIDQSNILTIYTYRSMTGGGTQAISDILDRVLSPTKAALDNLSMGDWSSTPLYLLQVIISSVSLMVIFQGATLIFARTVTLLLAMIFSPLMLLPVGIHSFIDKYRDMVIKYFSNGVLMGPIFMFLLLLGVQVGAVAGNIVGTNNIETLNSATGAGSGVLAAAITSILVIIVLQLAITVAKNLSGELGVLLAQKVSAFTGNLALGGTGSALRNTLGRFAVKAQAKGWMKGKEGTGRHRLMTKLYGSLGKNTYDVRGTKAFKSAAGTSLGKNIGLNDLGTASRSSAKSRLDKQMYDASRYYNSLGNDGKKRYINSLRNSIPGSYNHSIADKLEGKNGDRYTSSLKEKMENDAEFNNKFNTANKEKDEGLREQEMSKVMDEHFKEEGRGDKHFSETINKPENANLKKEYVKIMREEKDEAKRTEKLQTFINDKFSKSSSSNTSGPTQPSTPTPTTPTSPTSAPAPTSATSTPPASPSNTTSNTSSRVSRGQAPSVSDIVAQQRLKERLREKYGTSERMENGKIVKEYDKQLLDNRIRDQKSQREDQYQENVLREVKKKEEKTREERGRPEADKKNILAQGSLKERLQQKYNKEAIKEYKRNQEETYQEKVLKEAREKGGIQENYKNNPIVSIGQSSNSPTFTTSDA
ncbi:MAG: hypothetical protein RI945_183, partial [Candidatus Parcubacteria bacterium]